MKKIFNLYTLILVVGVIASCREYVEVEPIGNNRTLKYTSDYVGLMNNTDVLQSSYIMPMVANDDVEFADSAYQYAVSDILGNTYTWQDQIYQQGNQDTDWTAMYRTIYYCNTVIDGVMSSEEGTEALKNETYAVALVHRAFAYWALVNTYGAQYVEATAADTDGVPLLLTSDLYTPLDRASVAEVYAQILSDLEYARGYLPETPMFNLFPSQVGVDAFLARIYLGMSDYESALTHAEAALAVQSDLINLNDYATNAYGLPANLDDPENIFYKVCAAYSVYNLPINEDVLQLLGESDLRYQLFTRDGSLVYPAFVGRAYIRNQLNATGINSGLTVPEVMLIKAECLARAGQTTSALEIVDAIKVNRVPAEYFESSTATSQAEALQVVLDERRRELFGRGLRWFDQKRLNLEPALATTVTRSYRGETYQLEPNSEGYVFPIFQDYIDLNAELGNTRQ